jgi:hypothetical protein
MNRTVKKLLSPIAGGLAGAFVQRVVLGRVLRMGGLPGVVIGAAASYAISKYMKPAPVRR